MYNVLRLPSDASSNLSFTLGNVAVSFVTKFNYTSSIWNLDILDVSGNTIVAGLALIPGINICAAYPELTDTIGSLVVMEETAGNYTDPTLLGTKVQLVWYPVGVDNGISNVTTTPTTITVMMSDQTTGAIYELTIDNGLLTMVEQ